MKLFSDGIVRFSKNGEQHACATCDGSSNLHPITYNNVLLSTAEIIFLGHKISSEGVGPDPGNVKATNEMLMPQNVSQLRSLLGALSYYGRQLPKMAARIQPLNSLLRKGVKLEFSSHHKRIV